MTYHRNNHGRVVLNVAEKPSVARALASAFSRLPDSRDGGMRREAAQIFTHNHVCFPDIFTQAQGRAPGPATPHTMITTSVRGHLATTDFPKDYGWSRVDPIQLFDAPLETIYKEDMQPLQTMLTRLSKDVHAVILWLDCDREGEAIADEVKQVCVASNPRLEPHIYRAKFSTVLDAEIRRALHTLGRVNDWFVQAVQARSQLDLRVGAAFTRFQTMRLQKKFQLTSTSVVSYGPCQFPTLGFVVERWARIETFVSEDFWFLELSLRIPRTDEGNNHDRPGRLIHFSWKRHYLYDRVMTLALYEACLEAQVAVVTQLQGRPKNKWRPVPLATVELQIRASSYLRIGSETLMTAAEELYQQGYISYPRTETEKFRPEFEHHPLIQSFANLQGEGPFAAYANMLLNGGFQNPRAGQHDDQAHPPITPCKAVDPNTIQDATQRGVYILVVKHYLACCSRDAIGKETSITVQMDTEEFRASGLMILEKNWLEIYEPWERWSTGQGELPLVQVGSRITPASLLMKEGRTSPPPLLSEVELISLMDRNGIGTDATIAQHISTIQEREYATKDASQRFSPTPLGIALVEGYNQMGYQLNKPDLRREMELECNLVANQQKTKEDIIGPILAKMRQCFLTATAEAHKLDDAVARHFPRLGAGNDNQMQVLQANFSECGTCQGRMALKIERRDGRGNQAGHPRKVLFCNACQQGWSLPRGQLRPKSELDNGGGNPFKCPICNFQVIKVERGDGYEGNGYHFCPQCFTSAPGDHGGNATGGDFRCFNCTHPSCSLASGTRGGDVEVFSCPFCRDQTPTGAVTLRKNSRAFVLSCSNYSSRNRCAYTIWLPRESLNVMVLEGDASICQPCSTRGPVRRISLTWKPGSVPLHLGETSTVCILCDVAFRQEMQVNLPQRDHVGTNNNRQPRMNGNGRTGNRARIAPLDHARNGFQREGVAGQGIVCYRCKEPGHFANNCPSNN